MGKIDYDDALKFAKEGKKLQEIAYHFNCSIQAVSEFYIKKDLKPIRENAILERNQENAKVDMMSEAYESNRLGILSNIILKNLESKLKDEPIAVRKAVLYRLSIPTGRRHLTYSHEKLLEIFSNYYEAIENDTKISLQQLSDISGITMNQVRLVLLKVGEKPMFKVGLKGESRKKYYPNSYK